MFSLPKATVALSDQSTTAPVATDLIAVIAPCPTNADGVPRLRSSMAALLASNGYSEGAEYSAMHMAETKKPVLYVPVPIATPGAIVRTESVHTGTSKVSIAVGGSGALSETRGELKVQTGGTVGTSQIVLDLSLDDGVSFKTVRLGTATSYTIPNVGLVVSFGNGTLVAGDTVLKWKNSAPMFDADGVELARAGLAAKQFVCRSWLLVGDVASSTLANAIVSSVNAYETENERFVYAKVQLRDRRVLESSRNRVAMAGGSAVTFAEVGATGDTITRDTGSFVTDGFAIGDWVTVTGSASNNVSGKVTGVTATALTFDTTDLANEGPVADVRITAEPSFVFASGGKTITRNAGSWVAEGFAVGDTVTIAGTASNDGEHVITTLTATVMTCAASAMVDETIGSCTASVALTETETAWIDALSDTFAGVSGERVDLGARRLVRTSLLTDYAKRCPMQWADSIRSYQHDVKTATWWKELGPLEGWAIDGDSDERVYQGLLEARISTVRTWGNGPTGAFIAMALTRATDGSILGLTHNMAVANVAQTVVQRETEGFIGRTPVLNPPDTLGRRTIRRDELIDLREKVNGQLQRNLLSSVGGEGQRLSGAKWTPATDDDFGVTPATLNGSSALNFNGTIVNVNTKVGVR